jgi:hypothetical protein
MEQQSVNLEAPVFTLRQKKEPEPPAAKPIVCQRAPARPHIASARVLRGPAYLPGEPIITQRTRHVVGPSPSQSYRTNTHSAF